MSEHNNRSLPTVEELRENQTDYHVGWRKREFSGWVDEQVSWKETCYIGDWSFLPEARLKGPDAEKLLSELSVNTFDDFAIGQAKHVIQCNEQGLIVAEGLLMRLDEDEYSLSANPAFWTGYKLAQSDYDASWKTVDTFNFQVQGPNSLKVLEELVDGSLRDIDFIHFADVTIEDQKVTAIQGNRNVTAIRMGMAGEAGFELQGPAEYADEVWNAVVEAGEEYGLEQLGARTVMINHLEACFPTRGRDYLPAIYHSGMEEFNQWKLENGGGYTGIVGIAGSFESDEITDYYRNPVEMGWKRNVALDHDFIGKEALAEEVENPTREMVTLEWNSEDVNDVSASLYRDETPYQPMDMPTEQKWNMRADKVLSDGELVGIATSRGYSYYFRKMLSLCTIDAEYSDPGTEVTVIWGDPDQRQKEIRATVAPAPYKEDKRRTNLNEFA
ncbi:glycine cleavage T C-terminal barrel domain-containing protein [Halobellus clavatus]|uniref:Vanillate/3-O-methylgallate O-demethylase n=1 Tax=Halobellus clavatus TaxID=660517 RepID=A0A1H3IUM6_9EURY|nr:glycine cleavage T C-terminal barrel domain-containing protein [Halobellus clavatus]SDY31402.1 vanillate/3-O-methylgallate O-demethylase [Halobellus clavatus]